MEGHIIRNLTIGTTIGLVFGAIIMTYFDPEGAGVVATLAFIMAVIAVTPAEEWDMWIIQMKCKHEYEDVNHLGMSTYVCKHCGKVKLT